MTADAPLYRIIQRTHISQWDDRLQQAVPGWDIRALWVSTGTVLPVFVPDSDFTPENVDQLIRHAGEKDNAIHSLGG